MSIFTTIFFTFILGIPYCFMGYAISTFFSNNLEFYEKIIIVLFWPIYIIFGLLALLSIGILLLILYIIYCINKFIKK